jgi:hypothetical protein
VGKRYYGSYRSVLSGSAKQKRDVVTPATRLAESVNICNKEQGTYYITFGGKYDELTPVFALQIKDPTAEFLKLYVRVVNSIHFMQNGDGNRVKI